MVRLRHLLQGLIVVALVPTASGDVVSQCTDDVELRAKLAALQATGGGTLTFACTPASTTIVLAGGELPPITTATTVDGEDRIVLSGGNAFRLFTVAANSALTLRRLALVNGVATGAGGAISNAGTLLIEDARLEDNVSTAGNGGAITTSGPLTLRRSVLRGNAARNGGAIAQQPGAGPLTLEDSRVEGNQTTDLTDGLGGGLLIFEGTTATVTRSRIVDNRARQGGGVFTWFLTDLTVRDSAFVSNGVSVSGTTEAGLGGALTVLGAALIERSLFTDNFAIDSGGIRNIGQLTVSNTTFSDNRTSYRANAITNYATANLVHVTIRSLRSDSPALRNEAGATMTVRGTVVQSRDDTADCSGVVTSQGFNLSSDGTCNWVQFGDRQGQPSGLGELADHGGPTLSHAPNGNSVLIDNGSIAGCPPTDQRGVARPFGVSCDIGAVELGDAVFADGFE